MNKLQKKSALRTIAFLSCRRVNIAIAMFLVFLSFDLLAEEGAGTPMAASNGLDVLVEWGKHIWNLVSGNAIWDWICKIIGILFCFLIPVGLNQFCPPFRRLLFRKRGKWRDFDFTYADIINSKKIQRDSHYVDFDRKCRRIVRDICNVQNKGVFVVNGPHAAGKRLLTQVEVSKFGDAAVLVLEWSAWCCIDGKGFYTLKEEFVEKVKRLVSGWVMGKKVYLHLKWGREMPLPSNEELQKLVGMLSSLWKELRNRRESRLAFILQLPAYYYYMASSDNDSPIEFVTVDFLDFDENYALIWKWGTEKGDGEWTWLTGDQNATDFMEKLKDYYEKHGSVKGETCKAGEICKSESERKKFLWSCTLGIPSASIRLAAAVKMEGARVWETFCEAVRECVKNSGSEGDDLNLMALIYLLALRDALREKLGEKKETENIDPLVNQLGFKEKSGFTIVTNALQKLFRRTSRGNICGSSGEVFWVDFTNLFALPEEKVFRDLLIATFGQIGEFDFRLHLKNGLKAFPSQFVNDSSREALMNVFADSASQFGSPSERIVSLTHSLQQVKDLYDDEFPDKYTEFIKAKKLDEVLRLTFDGLLGVCPSQFIAAQFESIIEDTKGKVDDGIFIRLICRLVQMAKTCMIMVDAFLNMKNVLMIFSRWLENKGTCLSENETYKCACICFLWEYEYHMGYWKGEQTPSGVGQQVQGLLAKIVKRLPESEQVRLADLRRLGKMLCAGITGSDEVCDAIELLKSLGDVQWIAFWLIQNFRITPVFSLGLFKVLKDFHPKDTYLRTLAMQVKSYLLISDAVDFDEIGMQTFEMQRSMICRQEGALLVERVAAIRVFICYCMKRLQQKKDDYKKVNNEIEFLNMAITDITQSLDVVGFGEIMNAYAFLLTRLPCESCLQAICFSEFRKWMNVFGRRVLKEDDSGVYGLYLNVLSWISHCGMMGRSILERLPLVSFSLKYGWLCSALISVWSINSDFLSATQKYLYMTCLVAGIRIGELFCPHSTKRENWDAAEKVMKMLQENPRYLDRNIKVRIDQARSVADEDRKTGNDEPEFVFGSAVCPKAQSEWVCWLMN